MTIRTRALAAALALATAALAGCAGGAPDPADEATTDTAAQEVSGLDEIAVTYVTAPLNVPSIAERRLGLFTDAFADMGIDVTYSELTTGPEQTAALASGDIQFLFAVGATSVILAAANGADVAIVDMYSRSPEAFQLVTTEDGPTSAADLAGLTIAGPKGTILHELLLAYLATAGLTADDVDFVDMGIPDAQAALVGGSVDVALQAGPAAYTMVQQGYRTLTDGTGLVGASIVVATSRAFADAHPQVVARFVEAHRAVLDHMATHEDEVLAMAAEETGLPAAAVRELYAMYDFDLEVTDADLAAMAATQEFMLANGMIEQPVDLSGLLLTLP